MKHPRRVLAALVLAVMMLAGASAIADPIVDTQNTDRPVPVTLPTIDPPPDDPWSDDEVCPFVHVPPVDFETCIPLP